MPEGVAHDSVALAPEHLGYRHLDGGSSLDGVLSIRNEQRAQLASGDDRPTSSDPLVDFEYASHTDANMSWAACSCESRSDFKRACSDADISGSGFRRSTIDIALPR